MTGRNSVIFLILSLVVLGSGAVLVGFDIFDYHYWVLAIVVSVIVGGVLVLTAWYSSPKIRYRHVQLVIILMILSLIHI